MRRTQQRKLEQHHQVDDAAYVRNLEHRQERSPLLRRLHDSERSLLRKAHDRSLLQPACGTTQFRHRPPQGGRRYGIGSESVK